MITCVNLKQRYQKLREDSIVLTSKYRTAKVSLEQLIRDMSITSNKITELQIQKQEVLQSIEVLKALVEQMSREHINSIQTIVTYGLKSIFPDRDYSLDIQIVDSRNTKAIELYLVETLPDGSVIKSELKDSVGGGILSVVGLIIQVYYIQYNNLYTVLFMDEALSNISSQYLPAVLEFIKQLSKKKDFIFVLVTHDTRLIEYGSRVYQVRNGEVKLYE